MYGSLAFFHARNATWAMVITDKMFLTAGMSTVAENLSGDRLKIFSRCILEAEEKMHEVLVHGAETLGHP